jgi:hypothetical protein
MSVQLPLTVARYPLAYLLASTRLGAACGVWWCDQRVTVVNVCCWSGGSKKRWARIRV